MPRHNFYCLLLTAASAWACGSDSDPGPRDASEPVTGGDAATRADAGAGASGDAGRSDAGRASGSDGGTSGACTGCATSEGCVDLTVALDSESADLPWKQFADESQGRGRLFAGIYGPSAATEASSQDDVDLTSGFADRKFTLCYAPGAATAFCFLDDRGDGMLEDASGLLRGSSDYRDTCSNQRAIPVTVRAGQPVAARCELSVSCD